MPHSPLKRRWLLARLLLQADPNWLLAPNDIIETLRTFITLRKAEFYVPLLEDKRMQLLKPEDAVALREHAEKIGSNLAVATISRVFFAPPPPPPEA